MSCGVNAQNLMAMFPCHIPAIPTMSLHRHPSLYRLDTVADPRSTAALLHVVNNVRYPVARLPEVQSARQHHGPPANKPLTPFSISDILQRNNSPPPPPASRVSQSHETSGIGHKRRRHDDITVTISRRNSDEMSARQKANNNNNASIRRPWDDDVIDQSLSGYSTGSDSDVELDDYDDDRLVTKMMRVDDEHRDEEEVDVDDCGLTSPALPQQQQQRRQSSTRQAVTRVSDNSPRPTSNTPTSASGSGVVCPLDALLRMASKPFDNGSSASGELKSNIRILNFTGCLRYLANFARK